MSWDLTSVPSVAINGIFWRMLAPRWSFDPLSGSGAARAGGRWNESGQPTLYLSDTHATAIAEYQQDLPRPGTLTGYDVDAPKVLDLADPAVRNHLGLDEAFLRQPWKRMRDVEHCRPPSWDFARTASDAGWQGLRVRSAQSPGTILVLWRWNQSGGAAVRVIDPAGDLPRDQASWSIR